jgi:predicted ATPase
MLTSIGLANLKCFDALRLDLARLTLLTGFNASGKSSSYQPLLLLTQALRGAPRSEFLSLNGPLVRRVRSPRATRTSPSRAGLATPWHRTAMAVGPRPGVPLGMALKSGSAPLMNLPFASKR